MTYCVGLLVDTGLVLLSDSRTNAGVDQINTFRKMAIIPARTNERVLVLLSAGNLAITQAVINLLHEAPEDLRTARPASIAPRTCSMWPASSAMPCARSTNAMAEMLKEQGHDFNANVHLRAARSSRRGTAAVPHLFAAGNFIESSIDTPYFQIGESKYGKPIIDRVISRSSSLAQAAKCALVSMDSTIRSNLSVGAPLDLAIIRRDEYRLATNISIDLDNEYFKMIRTRWGFALQEVFSELPNPNW